MNVHEDFLLRTVKNILGLTIKNNETYEFITTKKVYFLTKIGQIKLRK